MHPIWLVMVALALPQAGADVPRTARDPRKQPLTVGDALFVIPDVTGRCVPVGDLDGDGIGDLFVERGGRRGEPERIDAVSARSGKTIRSVWSFERRPYEGFVWDAGDDVDGDGVADLLLGFPRASANGEYSGSVHVVSGKDGTTLYTVCGASAFDCLGCSVAFLGDVDGDGFADFAVGAPQFDPHKSHAGPQIVGSESTSDDGRHEGRLKLSDGTTVAASKFWAELLGKRSESPGYASVRSGRGGSEIRRHTGEKNGHGFGRFVTAVRDPVRRGTGNLLVQCDLHSDEPLRVFGGSSREVVLSMRRRCVLAGCGGDIDGDGVEDFILDELDWQYVNSRFGRMQCISGKASELLFSLGYPDFFSDYGITVSMGDIDGDGLADIAFGEANFNLNGPDSPEHDLHPPDLRKLTFAQALALESSPWCAFSWESGCAIVYSGRTHTPILGVWAEPGSRQGIGLDVAPLPDVSGDGMPDVLVADMDKAYVFAGPGRTPQ